MGYILPVTSYRSVQYANRLQQNKRKLQVEQAAEPQKLTLFQKYVDDAFGELNDQSTKNQLEEHCKSSTRIMTRTRVGNLPMSYVENAQSTELTKYEPTPRSMINHYV